MRAAHRSHGPSREPGQSSSTLFVLRHTQLHEMAGVDAETAELARKLEDSRERERAVGDVLRAIARSEGLPPVFKSVVDAANQMCDGEYSALYLAEGDVLRVTVFSGGSHEQFVYERSHPHTRDRQTLVGRIALICDAVHIPDVLADPEYSWEGQRLAGYRSLVGVPILVDDELIGVIGVVRTVPEPFSADQIGLLRTFADQVAIAIVNARLLDAVDRQRTELSRFVSPQVAELLSSEEGQRLLAGHRAYISVLFSDLRGFTTFVETAAPEEVFELLREYHALIGELLPGHGGTLEHFAGDGVMLFFNDPAPVLNHELRAIEMALGLQERFRTVATAWDKRGMEVGLGIGIAAGYATLGRIGFEGRYDYGALGPVTNLASRLSTFARPGQVLISPHVFAAAENEIDAEPIGEVELKGFVRPIRAYRVSARRQ
jgi:class 3 adenylate cyclase/putative methionine-R-sulfoxide reductase with GAF domain